MVLRDVTNAFRATCEALLHASERWEEELRAEQGDETYEQGRVRGEGMRTGILEGLLLRSLVVGRKP